MKKTIVKKKFIPEGALYYATIKSRHPSHNVLRRNKKLQFPFPTVIRFGSQTELDDTIAKGGKRKEINTVQAVKNSASKLLMKECFTKHGIPSAFWCKIKDLDNNLKNEKLKFPIVAKNFFGSRGRGNTLLKTKKDLDIWKKSHDPENYIFEQYHGYTREYRIHVSSYSGKFYTCRKMLKVGTLEDKKWQRHDDNCVWILESNKDFDAPVNWKEICEAAKKALNAVGLHIGAIDVKVQSAKNADNKKREKCKFIILETNSAPSFGEITEQMYLEELRKLILNSK